MIRPARPVDAAAVADLETRCFGAEAWGAAAVAEELTGVRRKALVAEEDGEVTGYAVVALAGDVADLQRIAVAPQRRSGGVGRALLAEALRAASAEGALRVLLEVAEPNAAARALYAAAGFTEIHRRRRYYRDGSDALVLEAPTYAPYATTGGTS